MEVYGRTDMASEAHRLWSEGFAQAREIQGLKAEQEVLYGNSVYGVEISGQKAADMLNKPMGKYYTLELEPHFERGAESFPRAAEGIARLICRCADVKGADSVLIAALGNPDITPDALGSYAAGNIIVTRHLKDTYGEDFAGFKSTALCRTGVLGTSGVESAVQIKCLCEKIRPQLLIAVDALAGNDMERLCRTVQICSSGIAPGSGVGNNREELSEKSLGLPVVAIGVPTVIDASQFSQNTTMSSMFVCPRNIDSAVRSAGRLIGYGINMALHEGLGLSDIDMLVG